MGNSVNFKISSVAIKEEATENVYEAPTASTDYIPVKEGFSPEITTEELEREVLDGSREKRAPRKGITGATLPMPIELTTNETEGDALSFGVAVFHQPDPSILTLPHAGLAQGVQSGADLPPSQRIEQSLFIARSKRDGTQIDHRRLAASDQTGEGVANLVQNGQGIGVHSPFHPHRDLFQIGHPPTSLAVKPAICRSSLFHPIKR